MAYCNVGPDSDLYAFASADGGFVIHVACARTEGPYRSLAHVYEEKDPKEFTRKFIAELAAQKAEQKVEPIGLPFDGVSFYNIPTLEEFHERLLSLKAAGYRVPEYALRKVDEELAFEQTKPGGSMTV